MGDAIGFALGGALFSTAVFLPIAYMILKPWIRFRGPLGKAWRPFLWTLGLLWIEKFVELGVPAHGDMRTAGGVTWFLIPPIAISILILCLTYRAKAASPASSL
jgi:hypothetical protein